ncbi:MAG TPA: peptidoglycan-binding domain-containing protein [Candidatus Cybelea sp.]|nr:peptidoglycan-binding domain-containing protein [Candidatus Cybelea sp.]
MEREIRRFYPEERMIILAEQRREWRAGLCAVLLVGGAALASWLALSAPQGAADLGESVVPAANAATLFAEQPSKREMRTGAEPIEVAQGTSAPVTSGDIMKLQIRLKSLGYDPGPQDGKAGPRTMAALNAYRKSLGLKPTDSLDRQAVAPLMP